MPAPLLGALLFLSSSLRSNSEDFVAQCANRAAIEQVYYEHRLGTKPPFGETLPRPALEHLVYQDEAKENALEHVYDVNVTPAMLEAEVQRIETTTRAPAMLKEIKAAVTNDPEKFANAFAKPFLVERLLRDKFENDDALHAPQRQECESVRNQLLNAKANGVALPRLVQSIKQAGGDNVSEVVWELTAPPASATTPAASAEEIEIKQRFGPAAQVLGAPGREREPKLYFDELPSELQRVLRAQLREAGDISAVIETPSGFLLYLLEEKTPEKLEAAVLTIHKRNFEEWLAQAAPVRQ